MDTQPKAKGKIIEASLDLFYYQGFQGTTIRQIAEAADVNLALISYYFGGKKGLLEQLMVMFYEGYFTCIAESQHKKEKEPGTGAVYERLLTVVQAAFDYLFQQYKMTRFIYRELSMDSMLIREVMTIYLAQEKYDYLSILEEAETQGELEHPDIEMMVLQLLNLLYMPFLQPQVIREVYHLEPLAEEFKQRYEHQLRLWINKHFQQKCDNDDQHA